ncbi:cytochrome c [Flavobacterium sp.]|uniref:cytochrome c n=1 Tax=Flavobacterium sp. TaxID=239 RepID=UPI0025F4444A|nr:cytochrome c [Flavobacterium sp.]
MKYKVLALSVVALVLYSCSSKSNIPTAEVPKEKVLSPELAEGKSLFENSCGRCHKLYDAKDYSAEQWKPIVLRMQKKARLDDAQGLKIYNYLTMN